MPQIAGPGRRKPECEGNYRMRRAKLKEEKILPVYIK
jgi:hypothetical protein